MGKAFDNDDLAINNYFVAFFSGYCFPELLNVFEDPTQHVHFKGIGIPKGVFKSTSFHFL